MIKEKIESIIFQNRTKDQLIEETLSSLSNLLADVFTGEDINSIKSEFPDDIKITDIGIELNNVVIYLNSLEFDVPCIEVAINMVNEKEKIEIGTYSLIFDEHGEQTDEILSLD